MGAVSVQFLHPTEAQDLGNGGQIWVREAGQLQEGRPSLSAQGDAGAQGKDCLASMCGVGSVPQPLMFVSPPPALVSLVRLGLHTCRAGSEVSSAQSAAVLKNSHCFLTA